MIQKEKHHMAAMKPNTLAIFNYLKEHDGEDITAAQIAEDLGLDVKVVNGCITRGLAIESKGLAERIPGEIELEDGTHKGVKFIQLTAKGKNFDPTKDEA